MSDESVEVELVELGPDADEVRGLGLDSVGRHWVGAFAGDRLVGAAGWAVAGQPGRSARPSAVSHPVRLHTVLVVPDWRGQGIGPALVAATEELAAEMAATDGLPVGAADAASRSVPTIVAEAPDDDAAGWLRGLGYAGDARSLSRRLPVLIDVPTADAMQALGAQLGRVVRAGDVVILTGDLGAGKTTLTQGIGVGLGITEAITSPTFVLSRIHRGGSGAPDLVHVDAYRLRGDEDDDGGLSGDEVDDIDLDSDLDQSVTVVEWGAGVAEQLSDDRLEIEIRRSDDPADEARHVIVRPVGTRWATADLAASLRATNDLPRNGDLR